MVPRASAPPPDLLAAALREDASRPLLTFYDDASDERVELSVLTFANWVAKTANFLQDGLGASPGYRISIRLPVHWQSAVWLSACWAVGAVAHMGGSQEDPSGQRAEVGTAARADVAVVAADDVQTPPPANELVVLGLGPFGLPRRGRVVRAEATGAASVDYDREIHGYGDHFAAIPADPQHVALEVAGQTLSAADLGARTEQARQMWQLQPGDRVLGVNPLDSVPAILAMLLVPLAAGTCAVLCRHLDPARLAERVRVERVVAVLRAAELESWSTGGAVPSYLSDLGVR